MTPYREGAVGRVRIGSGGTASIHLLPRAIAAAKKRMPGLESSSASATPVRCSEIWKPTRWTSRS
jgi:DNA-binding transcriptional LysR family regulator